MRPSEKIFYVSGAIIAGFTWLFLVGYVLYELFDRTINDSGDPFPVLTLLVGFAILVRQASLSAKFKSIQEWINK